MAGETPCRGIPSLKGASAGGLASSSVSVRCCSRERGKVPAPGVPGQKQAFNGLDFSCENVYL